MISKASKERIIESFKTDIGTIGMAAFFGLIALGLFVFYGNR